MLAFFGLMTAQASAALFSCLHSWHPVNREPSGEQAIPVALVDIRTFRAQRHRRNG
jgi:hypothetical protein